jgi:hypothetical protein
MMWQPIASAPYYMELELAVIDEDGPLIFACERGLDGWINAGTGIQVDVHPTHWRPWTTSRDE